MFAQTFVNVFVSHEGNVGGLFSEKQVEISSK